MEGYLQGTLCDGVRSAMASVFDKLDPDQKIAAGLARNGTVSAGAGSGKTTVLAARYLRLVLEEGADVGSILSLTFTRKAAAEMYGRIYGELVASSDPRARAQIERFAEAHISTIDSFCSLVLRSSAQDYGYPPSFAVDDGRCRAIAESESLAFLLERREDPALAEILARLGFERAWRELFADIAYRLCTPAIRRESDFSAMPARARAFLAARAKAEADLIASSAADILEAASGIAAPREGTAAAIGAARALPADVAARSLPELSEAAAPFLRVDFRRFGRSEAETLVKTAAKAAKEAALRIGRLVATDALLPISDAACALFSELGDRYNRAKRSEAVMSFRDTAVCAVDLLLRRPEIRAHWKRRFRFIMIDEFQDDDELQKELLYLLAERLDLSSPRVPTAWELDPGKLFFVGDEKQSIYRFRGADVAVFRRLGEELSRAAPGGGATSASLRMNYRSEPGLVDFFNEVFARVLGGATRDFEARFEPIGARAPRPGIGPTITYLLKPKSEGEDGGETMSDDEAIADAVARYIKENIGGGRIRVYRESSSRRESGAHRGTSEAAWRAALYDDVAILLRSTSKQYLLERFLRLHDVPYASGDPRGLFVESPANDVYAALRLALLPDDRVAYATVLRSPLVGLSDDAFVLVLADQAEPFAPLENGPAMLDLEDRARFERGRRLYGELCAMIDRRPIAEILTWLWYEAGLRLSILRRPDAHPYLEHYDYLFKLAVDADAAGSCLAAFVSGLEPLMGSPEKLADLDAQREAARGVRLMTIHKSKGLEFPIVVVPGMENRGRDDAAGAAWYLSRDAGVTLRLKSYDEPGAVSANVFYDAAREEEEAMRDAETKRLFYVACTRAEAHLVFAGIETGRSDARGASFHALLAGGGGLRGEGGEFASMPAAVRVVPVPDLGVDAYRALFSGRGPRPLDALAQAYASAKSIDRSFAPRVLPVTAIDAAYEAELGQRRDAAFRAERLPASAYDALSDEISEDSFGTLCHAVLEDILSRPPRQPRIPEALLSAIPEPRRELLLAEALRLARGFQESELGRQILAAREIAVEKSFVLELDGGRRAVGRMDLFAESGDAAWIVDFKTNETRIEGEYDLQLALYREAARAFAPGRKVRSWLFWLRAGRAEERGAEFASKEIMRYAEAADRGGEPDAAASFTAGPAAE
jgi:ATP-dependent exoDNAse (exonuclease V) beta subunit